MTCSYPEPVPSELHISISSILLAFLYTIPSLASSDRQRAPGFPQTSTNPQHMLPPYPSYTLDKPPQSQFTPTSQDPIQRILTLPEPPKILAAPNPTSATGNERGVRNKKGKFAVPRGYSRDVTTILAIQRTQTQNLRKRNQHRPAIELSPQSLPEPTKAQKRKLSALKWKCFVAMPAHVEISHVEYVTWTIHEGPGRWFSFVIQVQLRHRRKPSSSIPL